MAKDVTTTTIHLPRETWENLEKIRSAVQIAKGGRVTLNQLMVHLLRCEVDMIFADSENSQLFGKELEVTWLASELVDDRPTGRVHS